MSIIYIRHPSEQDTFTLSPYYGEPYDWTRDPVSHDIFIIFIPPSPNHQKRLIVRFNEQFQEIDSWMYNFPVLSGHPSIAVWKNKLYISNSEQVYDSKPLRSFTFDGTLVDEQVGAPGEEVHDSPYILAVDHDTDELYGLNPVTFSNNMHSIARYNENCEVAEFVREFDNTPPTRSFAAGQDRLYTWRYKLNPDGTVMQNYAANPLHQAMFAVGANLYRVERTVITDFTLERYDIPRVDGGSQAPDLEQSWARTGNALDWIRPLVSPAEQYAWVLLYDAGPGFKIRRIKLT